MTNNSESIDISLHNFYKSWCAFRRNKRLSRSIIAFQYNLEDNLFNLAKDVQTGYYHHGNYKHMQINDPKPRHIVVAGVRDRVVHQLLYNYLEPIIDHRLDYDVWSCRKGKGLHSAFKRVHELFKRHPFSWVWRGDIVKFFDNINHQIINSQIRRFVKDNTALEVLIKVINSYKIKPNSGMPIGNLTSQIFANIYLNEFDRYVRHTIKPTGYIRYGDDFILLTSSRKAAQDMRYLGTRYLNDKLHLRVHKANNIILPICHGIKFLGVNHFLSGRSISKMTWNRINHRLNIHNISSYDGFVKSMGSSRQLREFYWTCFKNHDL